MKTLLIVEDEAALLNALHEKFASEGFRVIDAHDGDEGLTIAIAEHPDLILLDIIMPKKDGISMLRELRQDSWGAGVPVIVLTNLSDNEQIARALESGAYDYLVKTQWKLQDLVDKVRQKLER